MAYSEQISLVQLRELKAFEKLADSALQQIMGAGVVRQLRQHERLTQANGADSETYAFVVVGVVTIVAEPVALAREPKPKKAKSRSSAERCYLGYFDAGTCFSTAYLVNQVTASGLQLDCVAANAVTLLEVDRRKLGPLFVAIAAFQAQLFSTLEQSRSLFLAHQNPTQHLVQDFFLRENYVTSSIVRVGRTDRCLDCNKCYEACEARYGVSRMQRLGPTLGRLTFPVVCRNCVDHPCVEVCGKKAITFNGEKGEIGISSACTGCGLCARSCPNGAITMATASMVSAQEPGTRKRAVKCDQCAGYDDRACLSACPTGALIEVAPDELFKELEPDPNSRARHFSDAPFLAAKEPAESAGPTSSSWKSVGVLLTFVVLAGLGIEVFLIRTQPEHSLINQVIRVTGSSLNVTYTSGRGIGHWFGYIGTGFMLASVGYSLRTRVELCKTWGSKNLWLSAHLWFGFVGAVLVTYHSALKLDRWASIACYLMWLVLLTGAVGRYLYGWVHAASGIAAIERVALRDKCEAYAQGCTAKRAIQCVLGETNRDTRHFSTVKAMLWAHLRDRVALAWIYFVGLRHLSSHRERREAIRWLSAWARQRRMVDYSEGAKPLLRHWNLTHIIAAIVMFILAAIHVVYGFLYKAV